MFSELSFTFMAYRTVDIIDFSSASTFYNWRSGCSPCRVSDTEYEIKYLNCGEQYQLQMMFCSKKYGGNYAFGLLVQTSPCLTSELACFP